MNAAPPDRRWLTLGAASRVLGVDPSTLRAWTDAGHMPAFRTPGGHRRYAIEDLRAFVHRGRHAQAGRMAEMIGPHGAKLIEASARRKARAQDWHAAFDAEASEVMRHTCRRLMEGLSGYLNRGSRQTDYLREGERAARTIGTHVATLGMTPAVATRAFLFYRQMVTDSVSRRLPLSADRKVQSIRRIDAYLNHALLAMMSAYEAHKRREQANTRTGVQAH